MTSKQRLKKTVKKVVKRLIEGDQNAKEFLDQLKNALSSYPLGEQRLFWSLLQHDLDQQLKKQSLIIETPIAISSKVQEEIGKRFSYKFQFNNIKHQINSNLIGGFRVRIGDFVYDASLENKLEQIKEVIYG